MLIVKVQMGTLATHPLLRPMKCTRSFLALPSYLLLAQMDTQSLMCLCMFSVCLNRPPMGLEEAPGSAFLALISLISSCASYSVMARYDLPPGVLMVNKGH